MSPSHAQGPLQRLQPFIVLFCVAGFVSSLAVNLLVRAGATSRLSGVLELGVVPLFLGIFVVWVPTVLYLRRFTRQKRGVFGLRAWRTVVTGAPGWLKVLALVAFLYAFANVFLVVPVLPGSPRASASGLVLIGTGHAMAFYAIGAAVNWAAIRRRATGTDWLCERGHELSPDDRYCASCGAPARAPRGIDARG